MRVTALIISLLLFINIAQAVQITAGTQIEYDCSGNCNTTWTFINAHSFQNMTIGDDYIYVNEQDNVSIVPALNDDIGIGVDTWVSVNNSFTMTGQNNNFTFAIKSGSTIKDVIYNSIYYFAGNSIKALTTTQNWEYVSLDSYTCDYSIVYSAWTDWSDAADSCGNRTRTSFDSNWLACCKVTGLAGDCWQTDTNTTNSTYTHLEEVTCTTDFGTSTTASSTAEVLILAIAFAFVYLVIYRRHRIAGSALFLALAALPLGWDYTSPGIAMVMIGGALILLLNSILQQWSTPSR